MSSDLQSTLELVRMNNYVSLAIVIAVVYDYFLTFSREVHYVWCRPWTWVSAIFFLVRYLGLCYAILNGLLGSTFVPGPVKVSTAIYLAGVWLFAIFYNAADFVMILRVYAMWSRSKRILYFLLFIYIAQVTCFFAFTGVYDNPNTYVSVTTVQLLNISFCDESVNAAPSLHLYTKAPRLLLGTTLLVLAVIQTLKQSVAMYKATKQWQPNRYMQQFVRDGIVYFAVNMLYNISSMVQAGVINSNSLLVLAMFSYITTSLAMPRFIISVRELYDRDHCHRRREGIDSGFGVLPQPTIHWNTIVSAIVFTDVPPRQDEVVEGDRNESEAIRLETLGDITGHV